jgi:hypothetical protein
LPIVGHVPDKVRIQEVVEAGQKSIEHLMGIFEGCSTAEDRFIKGEGSLKLLLTTQDRQRCDSLIKLLAQNQTWQVPTLAWQRGGTFLDQRDLKHEPLDKYVPAYWRDVTWRRFTDEMMPDLLRDPLALRQEYFADNLQMVGALHHAGVPFMAGTNSPILSRPVSHPWNRSRRRPATRRGFLGWKPALVQSNPARSPICCC